MRKAWRAGRITDVTQLTGGTQNILLCFRRGARNFVHRRAPRSSTLNGDETMRRDLRMLGALANSDVPHPRLIAACGEGSLLGGAFCLMEPIEGFNATQWLPPLHASDPRIRWHMGIAIVDGIAALRSVDYKAVGLEGFDRPDNYLERQVPRWRRQLESYAEYAGGWAGPGEIPAIDRVARWLNDNRPPSFAPGIIHGDYHFATVLYRYVGPQPAAIVDRELTTIGDPLVDLGGLLSTWADQSGVRAGAEPWGASRRHAGWSRVKRTGACVTCRPSIGTSCCPATRSASSSKDRMPVAAAGKAQRDIGDRLNTGAINLFERALSVIENRTQVPPLPI